MTTNHHGENMYVNGLGFYWKTPAVDNIDSFMYIVKTRLTDINLSKIGIPIVIHLENVVVITYLKEILN